MWQPTNLICRFQLNYLLNDAQNEKTKIMNITLAKAIIKIAYFQNFQMKKSSSRRLASARPTGAVTTWPKPEYFQFPDYWLASRTIHRTSGFVRCSIQSQPFWGTIFQVFLPFNLSIIVCTISTVENIIEAWVGSTSLSVWLGVSVSWWWNKKLPNSPPKKKLPKSNHTIFT